MSKDVECPYCRADVDINHDDGYGYEEDGCYEQECPECDRVFSYTTWISIHHEARRADCLNGAPHKYERTKTWPKEFAVMRCVDCGHETPLSSNAGVTARGAAKPEETKAD